MYLSSFQTKVVILLRIGGLMYLTHLHIKNHPILKDLYIDLVNPKTGKPYSVIAFVGENGCGKTTLLNEIFDYENSKFIIEKEKENSFLIAPYSSLFLRQSSLARNAMKEIGKLIDGKDRYSVHSQKQIMQNVKTTNPIEDKQQGLKLLEILDDAEIYKLFKEGAIGDVACGAEISKLINGKKAGHDISNYSSGQQEILLKLKDLNEFYAGTDSVLLDEPETSLHPRWQLKIVSLIRALLTDTNKDTPQIFLATHSEKVLQSLIGKEDALIIRLYKEKGIIKIESVDQMGLILPKPTFAELDYVIFKIDTFEYCSELYDLLEWRTRKKERAIDKIIRNSGFYDENVHYKEWYNELYDEVSSYNIATYCRNYFHHPKDREVPSDEQLHYAIELLRNVVLNLDQK